MLNLKITFLALILVAVGCPSIFAQNDQPLDIMPSYPNTAGKDYVIDAPWRVKSSATPIPFILEIRGADLNDLEELISWTLCLEGESTPFHAVDYQSATISTSYFMDWAEYTPDYIGGFAPGDTIRIVATMTYQDDLTDVCTFVKHLQVIVGEAFPNINGNWYYGDTHVHTSFTDNLNEYGGSFKMLQSAGIAMGMHWSTTNDHSSNNSCWVFPIYNIPYSIDDLESHEWESLGDSCNDYSTAEFQLIRGQEITCDDGMLPIDQQSIHLLSYGNTSFVDGPIGWIDPLLSICPDPNNLRPLVDVVSEIQQSGGFAYAAHPSHEIATLLVFAYVLPWDQENLGVGLSFPQTVFCGLEAWNMRTCAEKLCWYDLQNPFPWNPLSPEDYTWLNELIEGLQLWDSLNSATLHYNVPRKVSLCGGSDAHGAFNYSVSGVLVQTELCASLKDNAFGKVRTAVYCPEGMGSDGEHVLEALRHGQSVVTDGPLITFNIDTNSDGIDTFDDLFIGDQGAINLQQPNQIRLEWASTEDFGQVDTLNVRMGHPSLASGSASRIVHQLTNVNSYEGTVVLDLNQNLVENGISSGWCFVRVEGFTRDGQYRCYTNPIWVNVQSEAICNSSFYPASPPVSPAQGSPYSSFVFTASYADPDGEFPYAVDVSIDNGPWLSMTGDGGNPNEEIIYSYVSTPGEFTEGNHQCHFRCEVAGCDPIIIGPYSFTVSPETPSELCLTASPSIVTLGERITLTASLYDDGGQPFEGEEVTFSVANSLPGSFYEVGTTNHTNKAITDGFGEARVEFGPGSVGTYRFTASTTAISRPTAAGCEPEVIVEGGTCTFTILPEVSHVGYDGDCHTYSLRVFFFDRETEEPIVDHIHIDNICVDVGLLEEPDLSTWHTCLDNEYIQPSGASRKIYWKTCCPVPGTATLSIEIGGCIVSQTVQVDCQPPPPFGHSFRLYHPGYVLSWVADELIISNRLDSVFVLNTSTWSFTDSLRLTTDAGGAYLPRAVSYYGESSQGKVALVSTSYFSTWNRATNATSFCRKGQLDVSWKADGSSVLCKNKDEQSTSRFYGTNCSDLSQTSPYCANIDAVDCSPDGSYIAEGHRDDCPDGMGRLRVCSATNLGSCWDVIVGSDDVEAVAWSNSSTYIAASNGGEVRLYNRSGTFVRSLLTGSTSDIHGIKWSAGDTYIAAGDATYIYIWDPASGQLLYRMYGGTAAGMLDSFDWSSDCQLIGLIDGSSIRIYAPFDVVPPAIKFTSPEDRSTVMPGTTVISGKIIDNVVVAWDSISVDGQPFNGLPLNSQGEFSASIDLQSGQHVVTVKASDGKNGFVEASLNLFAASDENPPVLSNLSAAAASVEIGDSVLFVACVVDSFGPAGNLDAESVEAIVTYPSTAPFYSYSTTRMWDDGTHGDCSAGDHIFSCYIDTYGYGEHPYYLGVVAQDLAGNRDSALAAVMLDVFDRPTIGSVQLTPCCPATDTTTVTVTVSDISDSSDIATVIMKFALNDVSNWSTTYLMKDEGSWAGTIPSHDQGTMYYAIQAFDVHGHTSPAGAVLEYMIVDVSPPGPVALCLPMNNAHLADSQPTLRWLACEDAGGSGVAGYTIEYSPEPLFGVSTVLDTTALQIEIPDPLVFGEYYWRVHAVDSAGNTGDTSAVWSFFIDDEPPLQPDSLYVNDSIVPLWTNDSVFAIRYVESDADFVSSALSRKLEPVSLTLADTSGISAAYFKFGEPPGDNDDFDGVTQDNPFKVTTRARTTIYVWLKDGVGNVDYRNWVSVDLLYDGDPVDGVIAIAEPDTVRTPSETVAVSWDQGDDGQGSGTSEEYQLLYRSASVGWMKADDELIENTSFNVEFSHLTNELNIADSCWVFFEVTTRDLAGNSDSTGIPEDSIFYDISTLVDDAVSVDLPSNFALSQNHPNPFNPVTEITYALPQACEVRLEIFNIIGQKVTTLVDGAMPAGYHTVSWDGTRLASGIYLYRLTAADFVETKKMVLIK